jgi:hypothetical protein
MPDAVIASTGTQSRSAPGGARLLRRKAPPRDRQAGRAKVECPFLFTEP